MGKTLPPEGKPVPSSPASGAGGLGFDRIASFRFTYVAIVAFVLLYVFTVKGLEQVLRDHFEQAVEMAAQVDPQDGRVADQIQAAVGNALRESVWIRFGGVRVTPIVLSADGLTALYVGGRQLPPPGPANARSEALDAQLLPATVDVVVSVPHNSLLANGVVIAYAAALIQILFLYERRRSRNEQQRIETALAARELTAARAAQIETELTELHRRVDERIESEVAEELGSLQSERAQLERQLSELARRENTLRAEEGVVQQTLEGERQALEELLDEALSDLSHKDEELRSLETQLKRAAKGDRGARRGRDVEVWNRRLRTLYKNLEVDDHAVHDLAALGDESLKLRAEEALKRLSDDVESAAVRRKVGGLPSHLTVFELGFAGKGRIYYTNGRQRRFRVLLIGAKNSQKPDLEYLSRLPRE